MAVPNTVRQRRYNSAVIAQQHNLSTNLHETLYNLAANVPPDGKKEQPAYIRRAERLPDYTYLAVNLQSTLFNLAANVPPDGRTWQEPLRLSRRRVLTELPPNVTILTPAAPEALPEGRALLDPRRPVAWRPRTDPTGTVLVLNEGVNVPPDGKRLLWERFDYPFSRTAWELPLVNLQLTLFAPAPLPDGKIHLWLRPRPLRNPAPFERPDTNRLTTLLNEGVNVPPPGDAVLYLRPRHPRPHHVGFQFGQSALLLPAVVVQALCPPYVVVLASSGLLQLLLDTDGQLDAFLAADGHTTAEPTC